MTAVLKQTHETSAPEKKTPDGARRCLASGDMKLRTEMIRFVIGPDNAVIPDLAENLPGAGLWVTASAEALTQAAKKNVFAKAAQHPARPSPTLATDVEALLRKRCRDLLGLAKGAGIAILGEAQTEAALRANELAFYLHAPDATRSLDNRGSIPETSILTRDDLGAAFGYDQIAYAGLKPHGLTKKIRLETTRLQSLSLLPDQGKNEG